MNKVRCACIVACALLWALGGCATTPSGEARLAQTVDYSRYVVVTLRNDAAPDPPRAGSSVRTYGRATGYALAPATRSLAAAIARTHGLVEAASWPIGLLGVHCVVFELPPDAHAEDVAARLARDRRVESVQPLNAFATLSAEKGGDPYRTLQRNLDVMRVDQAHRWSRGSGVQVGIIDTGVDGRHPDLAGRITRQQNLVAGAADAVHAERHGTAVAGVIGAIDANHEGIVGVAPEAELHVLRACWPHPEDDARGVCSTLTLAKALAAAIDARLDVVNLSIGGPADPLLTRIVEVGLERGVVFVGATPQTDPHASFPTNIPGVIAVHASGDDLTPDASSFAPVLAPGRDVLTLAPGGRYDFASGNSLAAASVSGGVALLLARDPALRPAEIRRRLEHSMKPLASEAGATAQSVDLCAALMAGAQSETACRD